jgi:membrane-associated phospholipid phosphatase
VRRPEAAGDGLFKAPSCSLSVSPGGRVIVFVAINVYWKISLHTAFVSAAATILTLAYGAAAAWVFAFLPLVGWARLELKLHTPAQVAAGAFLAAAIVTGTMWGFGLVV